MSTNIAMTETNETSSTAALLYLASPALPIGAFAYSQGLEQAIELEWVTNADSLYEWTEGVIKYALCQTDIPVFLRIRAALASESGSELEKEISKWNEIILANRETEELYNEDINLGKALLRLLKTQGLLKTEDKALIGQLSFVTAYAVASHELKIPSDQGAIGLIWGWLENQITVSCKVIPLGQTDGQSVLLRHMPHIDEYICKAKSLIDEEIGGSLPGMAMASALHETQYSRLFRS